MDSAICYFRVSVLNLRGCAELIHTSYTNAYGAYNGMGNSNCVHFYLTGLRLLCSGVPQKFWIVPD